MNSINTTDIAVTSSPGADINATTLLLVCHLYGLMKEWLHEDSLPVESTDVADHGTNMEKDRLFSDIDCNGYRKSDRLSGVCANNSMMYKSNLKFDLFHCLSYHFMTYMGARSSCTDNLEDFDNDTKAEKTMTLLSKDRFFFAFMEDILNASNICHPRNNTLTWNHTKEEVFSDGDCDVHHIFMEDWSAERKCTYNTTEVDNGGEMQYRHCLIYRFMKSLGAQNACQMRWECLAHNNPWMKMVLTAIYIIGFVGNALSLYMYCRVVETPTIYQLQWLAAADTTYLVAQWIFDLQFTLSAFGVRSDVLNQGIWKAVYVCSRPLLLTARSCSVWLTVLIGLYRYLTVCKPFGILYSHSVQHGRKYVVLVAILSFVYNIPHFFEYYLRLEGDAIYMSRTNALSWEFYVIYWGYARQIFVVGIPFLILLFITVSILAKLRKKKKKKRNMQTSVPSQDGITFILVLILVTFIICHIPNFISCGINWIINQNSPTECGSVMYYIDWLAYVGLLVNSSANGFIYFFLNKNFRAALVLHCRCKKSDATESIELEKLASRVSRGRRNVPWNFIWSKLPPLLQPTQVNKYADCFLNTAPDIHVLLACSFWHWCIASVSCLFLPCSTFTKLTVIWFCIQRFLHICCLILCHLVCFIDLINKLLNWRGQCRVQCHAQSISSE